MRFLKWEYWEERQQIQRQQVNIINRSTGIRKMSLRKKRSETMRKMDIANILGIAIKTENINKLGQLILLFAVLVLLAFSVGV